MSRSVISLIEAEYRRYRRLGEGSLEQLGADELAESPGTGNSIATIVWHIAGNLESRFTDFLESDGEKPWRNREDEFAPREASSAEVMETWERGWGVLMSTLESLEDDDLARTVTIRGVELRVVEALLRSLAHTSYHVGQVAYAAKALRGDAWRYLSIAPGGTAEYNANPVLEKGPPS